MLCMCVKEITYPDTKKRASDTTCDCEVEHSVHDPDQSIIEPVELEHTICAAHYDLLEKSLSDKFVYDDESKGWTIKDRD